MLYYYFFKHLRFKLISVPKLTNFYYEISKDELILEIPRLKRHLVAAEIDLEKIKIGQC